MSDMAGNPYVSNAVYFDRAPELRIIDATLALAFEQRTANLIAYLPESDGDDYEAVHTTIKERLGLK